MADKVKVTCLDCGATNNYPLQNLGKRVVCGRCRSGLPEPGSVLEPSPQQVSNLLNYSSLPLLIEFYSPDYAPCHLMNPAVESLAKRRAGELIALKINVNQYSQIAASLGIQNVPAFIVFYKGNERGRSSGTMSETDFSLWVASKV